MNNPISDFENLQDLVTLKIITIRIKRAGLSEDLLGVWFKFKEALDPSNKLGVIEFLSHIIFTLMVILTPILLAFLYNWKYIFLFPIVVYIRHKLINTIGEYLIKQDIHLNEQFFELFYTAQRIAIQINVPHQVRSPYGDFIEFPMEWRKFINILYK